MAIWRGTGGSGESTSDSSVLVTTQKAVEAAASAAAALVSENNAETAETNAETAATAAAASAATANTRANNAATSATAAATSATNAAASATASAASATSSAASAATATTKASEASTSASNAYSSAVEAASAEDDALASADNAATSASASAASATTATTQATNAATSATNAVASAATATTKASEASTSATNAAASATSATGSASTATTQATAASGSATAAASSASSASTSASTATTQANNASTSATNAANSATAASTSASTATTQATNASTSATNAAISETNAASSASTATAAKDAALAALDSFDDRYLGAKATDPSVDNDGNALAAGALYYNTTDDVMKVYEGSLWVAAYASLSGALLSANNLSDLASVSAARTNLGLGTAATTASTTYATAAQGTKADSALQINPALGTPVSGNLSNCTFPTLNQNTTGTASNVTGTVAIANGGTGETTRQNAIDALAGAVTSGQYLRGNGTDVVMSAIQAADVPTLNQSTTGTAANVTGTVAIAKGGTASTTAAAALTALGAYPASNPSGYTNNTGTVTGVTGTAPVVSSGGTAPVISMAAATSVANGYMTSTYAAKLDGIATGATNVTNTNQLTNGAGFITSSGSISGNAATATTADQIDSWPFRNTGSTSATVPDTIESNGISYTIVSLLGQTDGALYSQAFSSQWQHQIFGDYRTGQIAIRGKQNNVWQPWRTVLDSGGLKWVRFTSNGSTSILASSGMSSVTYNGVGDFTANFSASFSDSNYAPSGFSMPGGANGTGWVTGRKQVAVSTDVTASSCRFWVTYQNGITGGFDQTAIKFVR